MNNLKNILVTGTTGFIGSVVTESLVNSGFQVIGIDNFQSSKKKYINPKIKFHYGDYGDISIIDKIFSTEKVDCVFHFAAETTVDFSLTNPSQYFKNNVVNGINLLDIMLKHNCRNIIFSSTAATYGEPVYTPIDEGHIQKPINSYGESKLMFEKILDWYHRAYGLRYNLFRYFNAAGAIENYGEDRKHETHLLPLVLDSALNGKNNLKIFGNDYTTKDGTCIRDYVHVADIAAGHILGIYNLEKNPAGKYNLGSGDGFSILEVIKTVEEVIGNKVNYEISPRREGDPAVLVASNGHARSELGWNPVRSSLDRIVSDSYEWIKKL